MTLYTITDSSVIEDEGITEPIDLARAKEWCKVTFSDDDNVIQQLITSSRIAIEQFCGISMVPKIVSLDLYINDALCPFELPYGPIYTGNVQTAISISYYNGYKSTDASAQTFDSDYFINGFLFPRLVFNKPGRYIVSYPTGMTLEAETGMFKVPEDLKHAIEVDVLYRYENRGDNPNEKSLCSSSRKIAQPHKRFIGI